MLGEVSHTASLTRKSNHFPSVHTYWQLQVCLEMNVSYNPTYHALYSKHLQQCLPLIRGISLLQTALLLLDIRLQKAECDPPPPAEGPLPCRMFTETALSFSTGLLNALVDLVSFSGILYTIYPPLFVALLVYSVGGTAISLRLGKPLVGLNFAQEAREADFR